MTTQIDTDEAASAPGAQDASEGGQGQVGVSGLPGGSAGMTEACPRCGCRGGWHTRPCDPAEFMASARAKTMIAAVYAVSDGHDMTEQEAVEVLRRVDAVGELME